MVGWSDLAEGDRLAEKRLQRGRRVNIATCSPQHCSPSANQSVLSAGTADVPMRAPDYPVFADNGTEASC